MTDISVSIVKEWDLQALVDLYVAGGWWGRDQDPSHISEIIRSSFAFAVAVHVPTGRTIGMGRVISDGISDAFIQDLVILPEFRGKGAGGKIVRTMLRFCISHHVTWIALIAEPGTEDFYERFGFSPMKDHVPMKFRVVL